MHFVGVIPARYNSSRVPGKPLIEIGGKPLIQWVYQRACTVSKLDDVLVATDDERVFQTVESFGGKVVMTQSSHLSGTDRVAEVAESVKADVFVNIQGDEPLISPRTVEAVCLPFEANPVTQVTSARVRITDPEEIESPHVVKVVVDYGEQALYFSRLPIPYSGTGTASVYKHLGIYAYRREFFNKFRRLSPSTLEQVEGLEQLRLLENGISIRVVEVLDDSLGIDTFEDLERVRPLLENVPN